MLQESSDSDPLHKSRQHDTSISLENMESLLIDEEVVGIITLEDVMEELLQVKVTVYHRYYKKNSSSRPSLLYESSCKDPNLFLEPIFLYTRLELKSYLKKSNSLKVIKPTILLSCRFIQINIPTLQIEWCQTQHRDVWLHSINFIFLNY
jgi:hypothetical protein